MPGLKSLDAYIWHRGWRNLPRPTRCVKQHSSSGLSSLHTTSRASQEPQLDTRASEQDSTRNNSVRRGDISKQHDGDERVRPQGWRALLQNKSLGEAASVLVLRDTEEKRGGRRRHINVEENAQSHNELDVTKMLESFKDQELDPAQSEVNSSIDSMRPDVAQEAPDRPGTIPQADSDRIVKQLSDGFNQTQLARYITQNLVRSSIDTTSHDRLYHSSSDWQPPDVSKTSTGKKRTGVGRGKRALAASIVRSVWQLEIEEEVGGQGSIIVHLDRDKLALALLEDKDAAFRYLENSKAVKIQFVETKKLIRIVGPKYQALEARDEIEAMLQEPYESELDVRPLKAFPRWKRGTSLDEDMLRSVAERCGCTLRWKETRGRDTLIVRGRERQATEMFKRMLVSNFELECRNKDFLVSMKAHEDGIITASPSETQPQHGVYQTRALGRFTTPFKIAAGQHGVPKQLPAPRSLDTNMVSTILKYLDESAIFGITVPDKTTGRRGDRTREAGTSASARWNQRPQSSLTARFGHIQHYLHPGQVVQRTLSSDILGQSSAIIAANTDRIAKLHVTQPPLFIPTVTGLPHALHKSFYDDVPSTSERRLRITLYPSPWAYSKPGLKGMPTLEMHLSVHPRDRHIEITDLTATLGTRSANLMLPHLGTDIIFTRRDSLTLSDPSNNPSIQQYLNTMMTSYSTTGQVFAPLSLRLRMPTFTFIRGALMKDPDLLQALDANDQDAEIEYFATSAQHESELCLPYEAYDLVYTRSRDSDTGRTSEGVSLRTSPPSTSAHPTSRAGAEPAQLDIPPFLDAAQMLLRQLNIGTGKTQRLDDYFKKAAKDARNMQSSGVLGGSDGMVDDEVEAEIQIVR